MVRNVFEVSSKIFFCYLIGVCITFVTGHAYARENYVSAKFEYLDRSPKEFQWHVPPRLTCPDNGDYAPMLSGSTMDSPINFYNNKDRDKMSSSQRAKNIGWIDLEHRSRNSHREKYIYSDPQNISSGDFALNTNRVLNHYSRNINTYYKNFISDQIMIIDKNLPNDAIIKNYVDPQLENSMSPRAVLISDYSPSMVIYTLGELRYGYWGSRARWKWRKLNSTWDGKTFSYGEFPECKVDQLTQAPYPSDYEMSRQCAFDLNGNKYRVEVTPLVDGAICLKDSDKLDMWNVPRRADNPIIYIYWEKYSLFNRNDNFVATVLRKIDVLMPTFKKDKVREVSKPAF